MKKIIYLLLVTVFIFTSCNQDDEIISLDSQNELNKPNNGKKVDVCHYDSTTGKYHTININKNALPDHLAHGDVVGDCTGISAEWTFVPDDNFENWLFVNGYDDDAYDGSNREDNLVLTANISGLKKLDVNNSEISDLKGIEDFISLKELSIHFNYITRLDMSNSPNLWFLRTNDNLLTTLNVTNNSDLRLFYGDNNDLTSLDVSYNTSLERLFCDYNELTSLDVSYNTSLEKLKCENNNLMNLNINNGNNSIINTMHVRGNDPSLTIKVDNLSDALAGNAPYTYPGWKKDATATYY